MKICIFAFLLTQEAHEESLWKTLESGTHGLESPVQVTKPAWVVLVFCVCSIKKSYKAIVQPGQQQGVQPWGGRVNESLCSQGTKLLGKRQGRGGRSQSSNSSSQGKWDYFWVGFPVFQHYSPAFSTPGTMTKHWHCQDTPLFRQTHNWQGTPCLRGELKFPNKARDTWPDS